MKTLKSIDGENKMLVAVIISFIFAILLRKWLLAIPLVFFLAFSDNAIAKFISIALIVSIIVIDCKSKGAESVLVKYNEFSEKNKLPKWLVITLHLINVALMTIFIIKQISDLKMP